MTEKYPNPPQASGRDLIRRKKLRHLQNSAEL